MSTSCPTLPGQTVLHILRRLNMEGRSMNLAVVTGAPGWLGTPLVNALAEGKKLPALKTEPRNVRCIVQPGVPTEPLKKLNGKVEVVQADLRDTRAVSALCEGAQTVFHCAGIIHPKKVQDLYDINVQGTQNVLDAAIRGRAKRIIFVSSNSPAGLNESAAKLMTE